MTIPTLLLPDTGGVPMRVNAENGLKLRATPNGALIRIMPFEESVTGYPSTRQYSGFFEWITVKDTQGNVGWSAEMYLTPAPVDTPEPLIIDVSSNNGVIDWNRARAAGVETAILRATMGGAGVDTRLKDYFEGARQASVDTEFYHLFRPDADGLPQAEHFLKITWYFGHQFRLAVDVERVVNPLRDLSKAQYADQLAAFVLHMQAETGVYPTIYTSAGEWGALVGRQHDALFGQCILWCANYTTKPKPFLPRCWTTYWLWQFTSSGRVDGIPGRVDLNRRNAITFRT